jgi:hypothetical protein
MQHNVSVAMAIWALPDVVLNEFYVNVAFIDSRVMFSSLVTDRSGLSQQIVRGNGSSYHDGEVGRVEGKSAAIQNGKI